MLPKFIIHNQNFHAPSAQPQRLLCNICARQTVVSINGKIKYPVRERKEEEENECTVVGKERSLSVMSRNVVIRRGLSCVQS